VMAINSWALVGYDIVADNIFNSRDGAYMRASRLIRGTKDKSTLPWMAFGVADTSKDLRFGTPETPDKERRQQSEMYDHLTGSKVSDWVPEKLYKTINRTDIAVQMFSIHYFFQSKDKLEGLLLNVRNHLKRGGVFIGTYMDGDLVKKLIRQGRASYHTPDGTKVWEITKVGNWSTNKPFGNAINVYVDKIGTTNEEYLVDEATLQNYCELYGLRVKESKTFSDLYEEMKVSGTTEQINLISELEKHEPLMRFSKLNRMFIFQKK